MTLDLIYRNYLNAKLSEIIVTKKINLMGWDVVQIGLRHNLPVDDAFAMVQEVARRMNRNIRLVYMNRYEYDVAKNVVFV